MAHTNYTASDLKTGLKLACNGFEGVIQEVCSGQLEGMCVVRLARGDVCVSASELIRFQNFYEGR